MLDKEEAAAAAWVGLAVITMLISEGNESKTGSRSLCVLL